MARWIVSILRCLVVRGRLLCSAALDLIHLLFGAGGWKVHLGRQERLLLGLMLRVVCHISALYLMLVVSESATSAVRLLSILWQILRTWLAFMRATTCIGIIWTLFSDKIMLSRLDGRVVLFIGTRHMDATARVCVECSCGSSGAAILSILLWLLRCCCRLIVVHCPHLFIFDKKLNIRWNFNTNQLAREFINYSSNNA